MGFPRIRPRTAARPATGPQDTTHEDAQTQETGMFAGLGFPPCIVVFFL